MNLRQKTWGVYIRPYIEYGGDKLVQRGSNLSVQSPCQDRNQNCTQYIAVKGGEVYALHKTTTSFVELRRMVRETMDELGYSINDIVVTEIIPISNLITPLT